VGVNSHHTPSLHQELIVRTIFDSSSAAQGETFRPPPPHVRRLLHCKGNKTKTLLRDIKSRQKAELCFAECYWDKQQSVYFTIKLDYKKLYGNINTYFL
jgi:hypothetical protein